MEVCTGWGGIKPLQEEVSCSLLMLISNTGMPFFGDRYRQINFTLETVSSNNCINLKCFIIYYDLEGGSEKTKEKINILISQIFVFWGIAGSFYLKFKDCELVELTLSWVCFQFH